MKRRRPRIFRDEVLAPWLTLGVILGIWWLGASMISSRMAAREAPEIGSPARATPVSRPRVNARSSVSPAAGTPGGTGDPVRAAAESAAESTAAVAELIGKSLAVPVAGVDAASLRSTFTDARSGGRKHEAMDIAAPRGTPVLAAVDGRVVKLFTSALGGLTIYQFDAEERFCYYYAHLDGYAPNLAEGQTVRRGQTLGFVGTTGNAPPDTPHLHFAVYRLGPEKRWWDGTAIDPYSVLQPAQ